MASALVSEDLRAAGAARPGSMPMAHDQSAFDALLAEHGSFLGRVDGTLVWPPRGDKGFGYDPIFVPAGRDVTFGEMDPAEKHQISHRSDAFRKLVEALKQ